MPGLSPRISFLAAPWLLLLSAAHINNARAEVGTSPIRFVGIEQECKRDKKMDQALERKLRKQSIPVALVTRRSGESLPICTGAGCGRLIHADCPTEQGKILGGVVVPGKNATKIRLWLHDPASGQTAYLDDYCQGCDTPSALLSQTARLIGAPRVGSTPDLTPSYCQPQPAAAASGAVTANAGTLFLTVYGDNKNKAALVSALKVQLQLLGRKVIPLQQEYKQYTSDVLSKIVAGSQNAQVLGFETSKDGTLQYFLYDQKTNRTSGSLLECRQCDTDKDALIARVNSELPVFLAYCFSESCGFQSAASPPPDACAPFPAECESESISKEPGRSGAYIDPSTAKLVKGALWGLFAAGAATSLGLLALNSTSAGTLTDVDGNRIAQQLWLPGWTAAGISIGILGLAIPTTIIVNRATPEPSAGNSAASHLTKDSVQCPQ